MRAGLDQPAVKHASIHGLRLTTSDATRPGIPSSPPPGPRTICLSAVALRLFRPLLFGRNPTFLAHAPHRRTQILYTVVAYTAEITWVEPKFRPSQSSSSRG
ncbi:MAG: hypothetical protein KTR25_10220 [Myxococcales bacterium]|nr:hypothetical protein [Myxococcales bacterium]